MASTSYTDGLGNAWLIDNDEGAYRGKLASPAYETPILQVVVAAPTLDEVKQAIEEYAGEYDRTNAKPRPRIFTTGTAKASKDNGAIVLVLLVLFAIAKGRR